MFTLHTDKQVDSFQLPEWIFGAEGDDDAENDATEETSEEETDSRDANHDDANDPKVRGLKTALERERQDKRAMQQELKELRKLKQEKDARELAEKSELERAQIEAETERKRSGLLAAGFLNERLNNEIRVIAQKHNFVDVEDAISGVDRTSIAYEQDQADPSIVTVDAKSIEKAVKDLAARKPHFIKPGTDDGEPSGSQFGARKKKDSGNNDYKQLYPGL